MIRSAVSVLVLALVCAAGCGDGSTTADAADAGAAASTMRLAVIPKGTTHEFWQSIHRGAARAAEDLGVDIVWKGPLKESDRSAQIQIVQQFVTEGVDGIALAPLDDRALARPVAAARERGIPVVIYDSGLSGTPGEDFASFVATDNLEGGRMAGAEMARLLDGRGKVVMLRYQVGSASTAKREQGFLDALAEHPEIEILSDEQYAGGSIASAKSKALNMIDTLREADGVFCPNESSTAGMLLTLRQENLLDERVFVGFDSSTLLAAALESAEIDALVLQDPVAMGARAVRTLAAVVRGEEVPPRIDTDVTLATPGNAREPAVARLLR